MKNTMQYKKRLVRWCLAALIPALASSCLMEYPEMTADGELGVDPTAVTVEADILIDLNLPGTEEGMLVERGNEDGFRHRIIVAAYEGTNVAEKTVIYEDIPHTNRLETSVQLNLHARNYRLAVWADYVAEEDTFYTADDFARIRKPSDRGYSGNTEYKDAFYACQNLDLTGYRDEWNARVPLQIELGRPVGRYELVATDVARFLNDSEVTGTSFLATLSYDDYLPVGFDALSNVTREAYRYMSFTRTISRQNLEEAGNEYRMVFDYIFLDEDAESVPVTLTVTDANGKVEYSKYSFRLQCKRGENTIVRGDFLTTDPDGGVDFDPGFDGESDVDLDS